VDIVCAPQFGFSAIACTVLASDLLQKLRAVYENYDTVLVKRFEAKAMAMQSFSQSAFVLPTQPGPFLRESSIS
jgi:hypothetical protein